MNFLYYVVGVVFTVVLTILYIVFKDGTIVLNQAQLINLSITALISAVAFFLANLLISKRKSN